MSEPSAVVVMGVSGSGKSTIGSLVAQRLGWSFFDADEFHPAGNVAKMSEGEPLTDADRAPWLTALSDLIASSLGRGESMVLACSSLKADFRDRLLEGNGAMLVYLKGDRELIETRMHTRSRHFMSAAMLDSQFMALEEPHGVFTVDIARDPDAICRFDRRGRPSRLCKPMTSVASRRNRYCRPGLRKSRLGHGGVIDRSYPL